MDSYCDASRPHLASHGKWLGELGCDDPALQLEHPAAEGNPMDDDRLTVPRADAHQPLVVGNVQRDPAWGYGFRGGNVDPGGGWQNAFLQWRRCC